MSALTRLVRSTLLLSLLCCAMAPARAQHATAFDVVDGRQAWQLYCANCHGPDGDLVPNVDLGHGNFRQPYSDGQLAAILRNGIPGTTMPGNPGMSDEQIGQLVAYLRSLAGSEQPLAGDATRGAELFKGRGACLDCHRVAGTGSRLGPDLTRIGLQRSAAELEVSLRAPERVVRPEHRFYEVVTRRGERFSGRLLNQDSFSVQLLDRKEQLRSFIKRDLRSHGFIDPGMPSVEGLLSDRQIADLVAYLVSLRG
jgi:putative heme-binding domain-containing protein